MRIVWLALCLSAALGEEGSHNSLEEWTSMFSSFNPHPGHGRRLGTAPSIEFSLPQIKHRGRVDVHVTAPELANHSSCNLTYVALYSPPDVNINSTTPIRYQSFLLNPAFCRTGNASFSFGLHNLHTGGYVAYLLQGGVNITTVVTPQTTFLKSGLKPWVDVTGVRPGDSLRGAVLSVSSPLTFVHPNEPTHLRVTAGDTPGTFFVSWNQGENSTGGFLRWSNSSNQSATSGGFLISNASRWRCSINDVCGLGPAAGPGFRSMGVQYTVSLPVAEYAGLTIYYAVGDDESVSNTFVFNVPLLPGVSTPFPQEWLLYADNGVGYEDDSYNGRNYNNGKIATSVIQAAGEQARQRRLQGVIVNGDVTYADGYLAQVEDYLDLAEPFASMMPFLITVGNHESDWYRDHNNSNYSSPDGSTPTNDYWATDTRPDNSISSGGECGLAMKVWPQGGASPQSPWYIHSAGLLAAVFISTEHNFTEGSEQWVWLNTTLATLDRGLTPWLVVVGHRPMYLSFDNPDPSWAGIGAVSELMREHLEPLYKKYAVSLTLAGHVHNTQRMCAVHRGACALSTQLSSDGFNEYVNPSDPVYFLLGSSGATTDVVGVNRSKLLLFGSDGPGYAILSIHSASVLEVEIRDPLRNSTIDKTRIVRRAAPEGSLTHWAIAAAAVGGVCLLVVLLLCCRRKRARARQVSDLYQGVS